MSLIIIGFDKQTSKDLGETGVEQQCVWCSNSVFYHLILIRTWFSYFFIPLFVYRREYHIKCPSCSFGIKIRGNEIKAAKRGELSLRANTPVRSNEEPKKTD
jgi:hypothetical protein